MTRNCRQWLTVASLTTILAFALLAIPGVSSAHEFLGANLNGIADFRRNHEFVDVIRQSRPFGSAADPFGTVIVVGSDGWPAGDFGVTLMAAQNGVQGLSGTYKVIFNGQATVSSAASGTVANPSFTLDTNTTTLDLNFPADGETMALRFQNVPPANPVKNLRVIRPGFDAATPPVFTPAFISHVSRFRVLRFMDWLSTNDTANNIVTWADRPTLQKKKTEAEGARWEAIVELANTINRDIWINIPVRANDEYVTNLSTLLRDTLNPGINVYVEYSNELWNGAFPQFDIQKQLAIDEVTANSNSPLRFDNTNDPNGWAFRRVAKRLKEISDIFKNVWGTGAINGRVRPVLAGQMANSFIVSEGIDLVDIGLNVRPRDVFYAISGAPYIFPSATADAADDEVPGLTVTQILDAMQAGIANAPNTYLYESHLALAGWQGLKLLAYEGGFDTFGATNLANKRLANLDPRIRTLCQTYFTQWHAQGFETFMWFNAGADTYDIQFGQWPLLEDMLDTAKPKNLCMDDIAAAPLPALTSGVSTASAIAGGNFIGSANPAGTISNSSGPFGFPGFAQYLILSDEAGQYSLTLSAQGSSSPRVGILLNGETINASFALPEGASFTNSQPLTVMLRNGINVLRFTRPPAAGAWTVQSFTFSALAHTLAVSKAGAGSGTVTSTPAGISCGADCTEDYAIGTSVTLNAAPAAGSTFAGWSGACSGTGTCTVIMNSAKAVTAPFDAAPAAPSAPTIGTATAGNTQATVTFTAPASNGGSAITSYRATSNPSGISVTGSGSPITVTGLTNGTAYTFTVTATNTIGTGPASAASNIVNCSYSVLPPSAPSSSGSGSGSFSVTGQPGCGWSASSDVSWITTSSSGTGSGTVNYSVAENSLTSSRTGHVTVQGQVHTVTQSGISYDIDGDGIPDTVELLEGTNPLVKDNDIFNNARLFAMQQYRDYLDREGDPEGIGYWTDKITSGQQTGAQVIDSFFNSPEFQAVTPIARLYFAYFLRIPDYEGLLWWVSQSRNWMSVDSISEAFAQSPEFITRYGSLSNADFVTLVYQNVLGRAPDPEGFAYWTGLLDNGILTRGQVMLGFSESPEFRASSFNKVYVTQMYVGMLQRSPEQEGFDYWVHQMELGGSGLDLINGFLFAPEYRSRFLP